MNREDLGRLSVALLVVTCVFVISVRRFPIWPKYKQQLIKMPIEIKEGIGQIPLFNEFDEFIMWTACWEMMLKQEKVKVPNKGNFEKGYMLKYENQWVPDEEANQKQLDEELERMKEWDRNRKIREMIND